MLIYFWMILLLEWVMYMNIVEVKFDYDYFDLFYKNDKFNLKKNLTVIVNTDRGYQFGRVVRIIDDVSKFSNLELNRIVRIASKKDYLHYLENNKMSKIAVDKCKELVLKKQLNMTILDGSYNFDRSQLLFRFIADERIDFRDLAKELGTIFRTRIELRQIGIRDKAKEVGGIGPCGRLLCCSSFLKSFDSVSINMAKNQNVSLNPSKISGVCGRLLCCLKYENEVYSSIKNDLPKVGSYISVDKNKGKVVSVNPIKMKYTVELEDKSRVDVDYDSQE